MIEVLKEVCEELGIEYRAYSGRGMYGKQCFAIFPEGNAFRAIIDIAFEFGQRDEDPSCLQGVRSDSMGLDSVIYWPRIEWSETEDSEDDEELEDES